MKIDSVRAVITGGASGLGRAVAQNIVAKGGKAVIVDLQEAAGASAAREIGASFRKCDVSVEAQVDAMMRARVTRWAASTSW